MIASGLGASGVKARLLTCEPASAAIAAEQPVMNCRRVSFV